MDRADLQSHLLHNLDTVHKREDDTFLCRPQQVRTAVLGETEAVDRASAFLVAEHSFRAVAKWQDTQSGAAYRRLGSLFVHLRVTELRRYLMVHPGVENTCAVDTQQYTQTRVGRRIIDVRKGVDA